MSHDMTAAELKAILAKLERSERADDAFGAQLHAAATGGPVVLPVYDDDTPAVAACKRAGLPESAAGRLQGSTPEELDADARELVGEPVPDVPAEPPVNRGFDGGARGSGSRLAGPPPTADDWLRGERRHVRQQRADHVSDAAFDRRND